MHFLSTLFAASFIALVHTLPYSPNDALTYFEYDDPYPSDAYDNIDTFLEGTLPMPDYYVAEPSSTSNGAENLCKKNKKKLTCCDGVSLTEYDVSKCDYYNAGMNKCQEPKYLFCCSSVTYPLLDLIPKGRGEDCVSLLSLSQPR